MAQQLKADLTTFYKQLEGHASAPLWTVLSNLVSREPAPKSIPHAWHYPDMKPLLTRSGELISAKEAERRVLMLENPGLSGEARITETLYAGLQLLLPDEIAPCHRHTQSALRFVLEGEGAHTAVDGEPIIMKPYDLVLTPAGRWHDHGNNGSEAVVWLDGLDIPIVTSFSASFAQSYDQGDIFPQTTPSGFNIAKFGESLRPLRIQEGQHPKQPSVVHFPFERWRNALSSFANGSDADPFNGFAMEFIDPQSGGSVLPTLSAGVRYLPMGFETKVSQSTEAFVFVGVEGNGTIHCGNHEFNIGPRDVVVVPSWTPLKISAQTDLVLFDYSDRAAQIKLGLWRNNRTQNRGAFDIT